MTRLPANSLWDISIFNLILISKFKFLSRLLSAIVPNVSEGAGTCVHKVNKFAPKSKENSIIGLQKEL